MGFILKIYLIGLIAFVPSPDGRQMTILVTDAGQGFQTSDGSVFPPHYPALLASAAICEGDCTCEIAKIGPHVYLQANPALPLDALFPSSLDPVGELARLVAHGGAWELTGSRISIHHAVPSGRTSNGQGLQIVRGRRNAPTRGGAPSSMPAAPEESEDFSWVPEMSKIAPAAGKIDPDCLAVRPKRCPIASRLTLTEGTFKSYKLAAFAPKDGGGGIAEFMFHPLTAGQPASDYTQAIADWTAVEIHIPVCDVTFSARPLKEKGKERRMTLRPSACDGTGVVEVALLNLPDPSQRGVFDAHFHEERKGEGSHFELFYELAKNRPARTHRPIPIVTGKYLLPASVGQETEASPFLERLGIPRAGSYSRPICTQASFTAQ